MEVSMSRFTLDADAAALRAALLVAIANAIITSTFLLVTDRHFRGHKLGCRQDSLDPCLRLFALQGDFKSCKPADVVAITEAIA
jgi:hypothetical protein